MPVSHETGDRRIQFLSIPRPSFQLAALPGGKDGTFNVAVKLPDGEAVTFALPPDDKPPMLGGPVALTLLFIVVSVTLLGLWATRALRNPLSGFARAAESFSLDDKVDALPERGPEEIRAVARAFNRMRARIKTLVADRIRLLAAMSHDLRTPITRLRLRSEFVADADLRDQMLRDLDQMKAMTDNVLSFLRDGQAREQASAVDIVSSLQTICDQFADMGHDVAYQGPDHLTRVVAAKRTAPRRHQLGRQRRASRHAHLGAPCRRRSRRCASRWRTTAPAFRTRRSPPCWKLSCAARTRTMDERAGFGLGLAIARTIAEAHGGTLTLHNGAPSGLIARIALPNRIYVGAAANPAHQRDPGTPH